MGNCNQNLGGTVPELYGWRQDGSESFIYMEHFDAQNLEEAWDTLGPDDRISVCDELRTICANLRYLEQDPEDLFVGNIVRAPLYDRAIHPDSMSEAGPFDTVKKFHDWFTFLYRKPMPDPYSVPIEPFRHDLPDDSAIIFTHGDLHRSNILITRSQPYRVVAVVDWEQSGWLPAYWEARKAHVSVSITGEWSKKYLQMIMCPFNGTREAWNYYTLATGC